MKRRSWRKVIAVVMAFTALFFLSSCSIGTFVFYKLLAQESVSPAVAYSYSKSDFADAKDMMNQANELVTAGTAPYADLESVLDKIWNEEYPHYLTQVYKVMIDNDISSSISLSRDYSRIAGYNDEFTIFENKFKVAVASSVYRADYYAGLTEAEIERIVTLASGYDGDYATLQDDITDLVNEYDDYSDSDYHWDSEVSSLYYKFVLKNTELAKALGYDNYLDYAYDAGYSREYAPSALTTVKEWIKNYIVPTGKTLLARDPLPGKDQMSASYQTYLSYAYDNYKDAGLDDEFRNYTSYLGTDAMACYELLYGESGNAFFSTSSSASDGAYTTYFYDDHSPASYFGPKYQMVTTLVHEFGHAYSAYQAQDMVADYDLCETQSQGNEMLFLSWIVNAEQFAFTKATMNKIKNASLLEMIGTVIICMAVNDFEYTVYTNPLTPAETYDDVFRSIIESYGSYDDIKAILDYDPVNYWRYVVVDNPGYYVSYAMSAIPALEIYCLCLRSGQSEALKAMNKLWNAGADASFTDALKDAGIGSPFVESTYTTIASVLSNMTF